jgi:AAA15 family ATPase/GTPase
MDGVLDQGFFVLQEGAGLNASVYHNNPRSIATGQIVGNTAKPNSNETSQRVSEIIKSRKIRTLLDFISMVQPKVTNLTILQFANESNVYAETQDGELLPVQFLGDGFVSLLTIGAGILSTAGGVLLLDEIDHTLHHTLIQKAWAKIAEFAETQNCQIFVTTHSKEEIVSIAKGVKDSNRSNDFQYLRFEQSIHNEDHAAIGYDVEDIISAEMFDTEVR